eukprot:1822090-Pyramimonas_sp.AAC.1
MHWRGSFVRQPSLGHCAHASHFPALHRKPVVTGGPPHASASEPRALAIELALARNRDEYAYVTPQDRPDPPTSDGLTLGALVTKLAVLDRPGCAGAGPCPRRSLEVTRGHSRSLE